MLDHVSDDLVVFIVD